MNLAQIDSSIQVNQKSKLLKTTASYLTTKHYDNLNHKVEHFILVLIGEADEIINSYHLNTGTKNRLSVDLRELVTKCLLNDCHRIIVSHNHPSGNHQPSKQDLYLNDCLTEVGIRLRITLLDHLIYANKHFYSIKGQNFID